jgi:hydroxylamine reductase
MTTNCIIPSRESYKNRIYTTGVVGFEGITHIDEKEDGTKDFTPLIE